MMSRRVALLSLILWMYVLTILLNITDVECKRRYPEPKLKANDKPKPPKLNVDLLPTLEEILEALNMKKFFKNFIRMGVTDTRLLLRLTAMDFQLMSYEWEDITSGEINRLKDEIKMMIIRATVPEVVIRPEFAERNKLTYGRIYMPDAVQSFEYMTASFGGTAPIGKQKVEISPSTYGCPNESSSSSSSSSGDDIRSYPQFNGSIVIVKRGICSFLSKAIEAKASNASGMIVVNSEDKLEAPSSGLGIDRNVTDSMVLQFNKFPILALSNTTWSKLIMSVRLNKMVQSASFVDVVPLKCRPGGTCMPLLPEEKELQDEVSWGTARLRAYDASNVGDVGDASIKTDDSTGSGSQQVEVRSFEFLTSNYGSQLPTHHVIEVVFADLIDACSPIISLNNTDLLYGSIDPTGEVIESKSSSSSSSTSSSSSSSSLTSKYAGKAVAVHRGGCRFDIKALNVQQAGGLLLVIIDVEDNALQRLGGKQPEAGFVAIPSIIVTAVGGQFLHSVLDRDDGSRVTIEVIPSRTSRGSDLWIELALTQWAEDTSDQVLQVEGLIQKYAQFDSAEIVAWLHRRLDRLSSLSKKSIDTDALS